MKKVYVYDDDYEYVAQFQAMEELQTEQLQKDIDALVELFEDEEEDS